MGPGTVYTPRYDINGVDNAGSCHRLVVPGSACPWASGPSSRQLLHF